MPLGSSLGIQWIEDEDIGPARNQLCQKALDENCDYIFFLSDDVLPPPNVLLSLLNRIDRKYPSPDEDKKRGGGGELCRMVTGVYWTKTYPPEPYLFNGVLEGTYKDWQVGEFFPIDMAGCDCLLINTEILREIPQPWFSTDWLWRKDQWKPSSIATEDFYFYSKARKYGYRLWCDSSVQCYHEDRFTGVKFGLEEGMQQAGNLLPELDQYSGKLIADLGSGSVPTPWLYGKDTKIVRFDTQSSVRPDVRCDLRAIPEIYYGQFDVVYASHVLEHFARSEAQEVIRHWCQLLKVGGKLEIHVPNLGQAFRVLLDDNASGELRKYAWQQIYGAEYEVDVPWEHKNGFIKQKLFNLFSTVPELTDIEVAEATFHNTNDDTNLKATAVLARAIEYEVVESITTNGIVHVDTEAKLSDAKLSEAELSEPESNGVKVEAV